MYFVKQTSDVAEPYVKARILAVVLDPAIVQMDKSIVVLSSNDPLE